MSGYAAAVAAYRAAMADDGWAGLPFFRSAALARLLDRLDARVADGAIVLPPPGDLLTALRMTPVDTVRVVILGQDPYPKPGDAHGLAFSYAGPKLLPASLKNIFAELAQDLGVDLRRNGNLTDWARQGVLLLNAALSVEAGQAGLHLSWGWQQLAREIIAALGQGRSPCVFILWGDKARQFVPLIGPAHMIIESPHPSPLSAYRGFFGSRPFSRANGFLRSHGRGEIDWSGLFKPA